MAKYLQRVAGILTQYHHFRQLSTQASETSTIYALSSGRGKSGVAVVRISGSETSSILMQLTQPSKLPPPRVAALRTIHDPLNHDKLDKGLVLWFPGPQSFTGEDVAELHIHGGIAVVRATLSALSRFPQTRQAFPGEFTKRSFLNGKMDLTEAEGVADLIQAETEAQRRQAFRQMNGALSGKYSQWRARLLKVRAFLEAFIDFGEEEQLEPNMLDKVKEMVTSVETEVRTYLEDHRRGERLRNGVHVSILGEPNVGKSSLLNALCQKPAAIVSPIAGTTRDVVESAFDIGGYPVLLSDTAGLRVTDDFVESEGIRRALFNANASDLILLVIDSSTMCMSSTESLPSKDDLISSRLKKFGLKLSSEQFVRILFNKIDLLSQGEVEKLRGTFHEGCFFVSCTTDIGMTEFVTELKSLVENLCGNPLVGEASLTQQRHRTHLEDCLVRLGKFWERLGEDDVTLAAYEVQQALRCIGKITGHVYIEEVLDVIFRDFCIGK